MTPQPPRTVDLFVNGLGVVAVITPWNWPYTMPAQVIAPALAAGNTVVWAPAPSTSVCSAVLVDAIADADLPAGAVAFLPGPGPVVGDEIAGHVADALARGADLITGGGAEPGRPTALYWQPTVLDNVPRDAAVAREETFGPVAPAIAVASLQDAITLTDDLPYGLMASIYTADAGTGLRYADAVPGGVGEHQRVLELLGDPPAVRRRRGQRQRRRPGRGTVRHPGPVPGPDRRAVRPVLTAARRQRQRQPYRPAGTRARKRRRQRNAAAATRPGNAESA